MLPPAAPRINIRRLYDDFDSPLAALDCGQQCAPHNPNGKPFCCDLDFAVPAAYRSEWEYLQPRTGLWRLWVDPASSSDSIPPDDPASNTPAHMVLLACQGPAYCQRQYRALSCRQFPFYPYITLTGRFLGLAYDWEFEPVCWVISHLEAVSPGYRARFVRVYDHLLYAQPGEYDSYANRSDEMRAHFAAHKRRIPLLHRNGGYYLISPASERLYRVEPHRLPRFGPYQAPASQSRPR